jgi:phosphoribosylanthranilate isomerase
MQLKVKICGIRTLAGALAAYKAGADFIGLNFVPTSRRKVTLEEAEKIVRSLPNKRAIKIVGVFQNQQLSYIKDVTQRVPLDYVQLHGTEPAAFSNGVGLPVIKAFGLEPEFDISKALLALSKYKVEAYLIDRLHQGQGAPLNPDSVRGLASHFPIMLAGGLNLENVVSTITVVRPFAIDVASGVESDGETDSQKIISFVKLAKS